MEIQAERKGKWPWRAGTMGTSKPSGNRAARRQFLRSVVALVGVVAGLGSVGVAHADWNSLGGSWYSKPAVGRNADGRLEVFVQGVDQAVWHAWQVSPNGNWSGWYSLGGKMVGNPATQNNLNGQMEVYWRGPDQSLFHRWQNSAGGGWSAGGALYGILTSDPTVVQNWDGRQEIFVKGYDNAIYNKWQVVANGGWSSGWSSMGGVATSAPAAKVSNSGGGVNVFYRGPDYGLYWRRQASANGPWEEERYLGRPAGLTINSDPVVGEFDGQRSDGRLVVFVRASDGAYWYRSQRYAYGTEWGPWISLGGQWTGKLAVASNWDGRLELIVRAESGAVYHTWQQQTDSDGGWNGWYPLGGVLISDPVIGFNADGRLEVFGIGLDRAVWHRWQVTPGGAWN